MATTEQEKKTEYREVSMCTYWLFQHPLPEKEREKEKLYVNKCFIIYQINKHHARKIPRKIPKKI